MKVFILLSALVLYTGIVGAEDKEDDVTEQTTESPIGADIVLAGNAPKTENQKTKKESTNQFPGDAQPHTIADFIIHPIIALKPRAPETENAKQVGGNATTPSPWQLFGFNAGQGLGSSVSSLAGTVTGWLGNRIQLPSLVDTPVRESVTTPMTTTPIPPSVIVKIQQRPSTKKPLSSISNKHEPPFRRFNRLNRYHVVNYKDDLEENDDSNEYNYYDNFTGKRKRYQGYVEDDEEQQQASFDQHYNFEDEYDQESGEEELYGRPNKPQNNPARQPKPIAFNKSKNSYNLRGQPNRKQTLPPQEVSAEEDQYEEHRNQVSQFKVMQQNIVQQLAQFHRGQQTPAVLINTSNIAHRTSKPNLLIKRNGQIVYVAPELLQIPKISHNKVRGPTKNRLPSRNPQPVLIVPLKRKGQPTQYIAIPWNQLGILNFNQLASLTGGGQQQPLILTIPQGVIKKKPKSGHKKKIPSLTVAAVPVLAETSRPIRIIPAQAPAQTANVAIATNSKVGPALMPSATNDEKAPPAREKEQDTDKINSSESLEDDDHSTKFLVVDDDATNTNMTPTANRQILDYIHQNRSGRQLNAEKVSVSPIAAKTKEQLIPVQIVQEPEVFYTTTQSPLTLESPQTETNAKI